MKKIIALMLFMGLIGSSVYAQVYPTNFLGIPVDGTKKEMIRQIQDKGFTYHQDEDYLSGEFNGRDVIIFVATNKNKVYRIMVTDKEMCSENQIRIRYNNLMKQFQDNAKYISGNIEQNFILDSEDISYEMSVHNKMYSATYLQMTHTADTIQLQQDALLLATEMTSKFTEEQLAENSEALTTIVLFMALQKQYEKNQVWFTIAQYLGKFYIALYYDNNYNRANGEDL